VAELLLCVHGSPDPRRPQRGDVICAFNRRRISACHAEMICHPVRAGVTSAGLRPNVSVSRDWMERTYQYRFTRVSATEVERLDLATMGVEVFGPPHIDISQFLALRLAHPQHRIFGASGAEVWYGGRQDLSLTALAAVWSAIETKTPLREADHSLWPLSDVERMRFAALGVVDFDDVQRVDLERPGEDGGPGRPALARLYSVDYRAILTAAEIAAIEDPTQAVDLRTARAPEPLTRAVRKRA
jgi:hypothetical protein